MDVIWQAPGIWARCVDYGLLLTAMPVATLSCPLLLLPPEVATQAVVICDANDVAALSRCCKYLHNLIYSTSDKHVWRSLYLGSFDDPRLAGKTDVTPVSEFEFDWKRELQRRVQAQNLLCSANRARRASPLEKFQALETLVAHLRSLPPIIGVKTTPSRSVKWFGDVIKGPGALPLLTLDSHPTAALTPLIHIHDSIGRKDEDAKSAGNRLSVRTSARAFVYDLRNYSKSNRWGPFLQDGSERVNWTHIDKIMSVMVMNAEDHFGLSERTAMKFPRMNLESIRPLSAPASDDCRSHDWAGIEGRWTRVISFMDYPELMCMLRQPLLHAFLADTSLSTAYNVNNIRPQARKTPLTNIQIEGKHDAVSCRERV